MIFEDDFRHSINENDWNYEVQVGGFGTGSFEWTTRAEENVYTDDTGLHIVPTITSTYFHCPEREYFETTTANNNAAETANLTLDQMTDGYTLNLTAEGTCTSKENSACIRVSNSTTGEIINPVQSARLTTKGKHNITYGKVEVVAKLPKGSWLWPAIWMMPEVDTYGSWPASGEIDIVESRGNDGNTYHGGRNVAGEALHWAPFWLLDAFWRTMGVRYLKRTDYSDAYHTFGMEWSENYIYTWIDSRIQQSMYIKFGKKKGMMFSRGNFAAMNANGSIPVDPWSQTGRYNTPFDEAFYLILNVAVGKSDVLGTKLPKTGCLRSFVF
jgi:hypothetical protein